MLSDFQQPIHKRSERAEKSIACGVKHEGEARNGRFIIPKFFTATFYQRLFVIPRGPEEVPSEDHWPYIFWSNQLL